VRVPLHAFVWLSADRSGKAEGGEVLGGDYAGKAHGCNNACENQGNGHQLSFHGRTSGRGSGLFGANEV